MFTAETVMAPGPLPQHGAYPPEAALRQGSPETKVLLAGPEAPEQGSLFRQAFQQQGVQLLQPLGLCLQGPEFLLA